MQAISHELVVEALARVRHPEIKERNLAELGMITGLSVQGNQVDVTLSLPFKNLPIEADLVSSVEEAIAGLSTALDCHVHIAEMSQVERAAFMARRQGETSSESGPSNDISHVIAVMSGKGGVGKSSVAGMLAVALRRQGYRVGVLDADITGPSIPKMFGVHQRPLGSPSGILPVRTKTGIDLMSINLLLKSEDQAVIWRGPLISRAIQQFWGEIAWGQLDYLVVDLPPGTSDASLTVMQSIPLSGVVMVTTPQDLAGMVVRKAASMAQEMGAPMLGLVENMSYAICPKCGIRIEVFGPSQGARTAAQVGTCLLGELALDPELATRCDAGEIEDYEAVAFASIARELLVITQQERAGMRTYLDCYPCFLRQALEAARMVGVSEQDQRAVLNRVMRELQVLDGTYTPPEIGYRIHRIVRSELGTGDPYAEIKATGTQQALNLYPHLKGLVEAAEDPLGCAVRLAIAGNVIDYAVASVPKGRQAIWASMRGPLTKPFAIDHLSAFRESLDRVEKVLYLADNAGETVFDRVLIETMDVPTRYAVKGSAVLNDATIEDASAAGLEQVAQIVSNGSDAPGTILGPCSPEFRQEFADAGMIIAKGQANYETLSDYDGAMGSNLFFLFQVKCPVIAYDVGVPLKSIVCKGGEKDAEI